MVPLVSSVPLLLPMFGLVVIVQSIVSSSGSFIVTLNSDKLTETSVAPLDGFGFDIIGGLFEIVVNVYVSSVVSLLLESEADTIHV